MTVCQALISDDKEQREEFIDEIEEEEYQEIRDEYFANLDDKVFVDYNVCNAHKYVISDFESELTLANYAPHKPNIGTGKDCVKYFNDYSLSELIPFIDWNPFFQVFQLRGTYPNRNYLKLFNDLNVGSTAKETFDDAQAMLKQWCSNTDKLKVEARGVIGFFKCNAESARQTEPNGRQWTETRIAPLRQ